MKNPLSKKVPEKAASQRDLRELRWSSEEFGLLQMSFVLIFDADFAFH